MHILTLEEITPEKITEANVLAGKGKCPPNDCGGIWSYAHLLMLLKKAKETGLRQEDGFGQALPNDWDTDEFDLTGVREEVKKC